MALRCKLSVMFGYCSVMVASTTLRPEHPVGFFSITEGLSLVEQTSDATQNTQGYSTGTSAASPGQSGVWVHRSPVSCLHIDALDTRQLS